MAPTGQHGRRIGYLERGKQGRPSGWSNPARLVIAGPVGLLLRQRVRDVNPSPAHLAGFPARVWVCLLSRGAHCDVSARYLQLKSCGFGLPSPSVKIPRGATGLTRGARTGALPPALCFLSISRCSTSMRRVMRSNMGCDMEISG